jgi:hypothetical protein
LFEVCVFVPPNLIDKTLGKVGAVLFVGFEVGSIDDVVEKDGHLKDYLISLRKLIVPQLWSFSKLPKHTVDMMVGMIKPPVLAVVFHYNIPPFSAQQFVGILLNP